VGKHGKGVGTCCMLAVCVIGLPVLASSIDLCTFRSPQTDLTTLFMTFNYSYVDLPDTPHVDVSSGRVSASFVHTHDEPDFALSVSGNAEASLDHFRFDSVWGDGSISSRFYVPEAEPAFAFAELTGNYADAAAQPGMEFRMGAGYGRLTDVSPLARAVRIETALLDAFVLTDPLSDEALRAIGTLIAQEAEFSGIGELVSEIESVIIKESGEVLNTRALLSIAEQIRTEVVSQQCGWITQFGIGYELVRRFGGTRMLLLSLSSDMSRPLSLTSQIGVHADISSPLMMSTSGAYALTASTAYSRRLSETTRWVAEYALQRLRQTTGITTTGETLEIQLLFDLGRVDLTVSGALSRGTGSAGWTEQIAASVRVDLL